MLRRAPRGRAEYTFSSAGARPAGEQCKRVSGESVRAGLGRVAAPTRVHANPLAMLRRAPRSRTV
jgi:hypothetical protein